MARRLSRGRDERRALGAYRRHPDGKIYRYVYGSGDTGRYKVSK